jgi:WD40 repeat protein
LAELESSCGPVNSVSFSCDDRVLATASTHTIRLWDVASGSLITTLVGDGANIRDTDFHPYIGYLLAAGDEDGRVYVWDVRDSSRTELSVAGSTGRLCWVRQREKKHILIMCKDGRMEMWDVDSSQQVQVFYSSQHPKVIIAVVSSDDGSLVASGSLSGMLAVYSTHTGEVLHSTSYGHFIQSVAFSLLDQMTAKLVYGSTLPIASSHSLVIHSMSSLSHSLQMEDSLPLPRVTPLFASGGPILSIQAQTTFITRNISAALTFRMTGSSLSLPHGTRQSKSGTLSPALSAPLSRDTPAKYGMQSFCQTMSMLFLEMKMTL